MSAPLTAFSASTGVHYPSWEALVDAEANGYVAVAIMQRGDKVWPWVVGPYADKAEAEKARARMRARLQRADEHELKGATLLSVVVRPVWQDDKT